MLWKTITWRQPSPKGFAYGEAVQKWSASDHHFFIIQTGYFLSLSSGTAALTTTSRSSCSSTPPLSTTVAPTPSLKTVVSCAWHCSILGSESYLPHADAARQTHAMSCRPRTAPNPARPTAPRPRLTAPRTLHPLQRTSRSSNAAGEYELSGVWVVCVV